MKINIPKRTNSDSSQATDYYCLIDNSGSIWSSISALKDTIKSMVDNLSPKDTISIGTFSGRNDWDWFVRGLSNTANIIPLVNSKISARGLTHFNNPLKELKNVFSDVKIISSNANSVFYFLSDGYSNDDSPESATISLCRDLSSMFSSKTIVGYGSNYNRRLLLEMSEAINGTFNHISDYTELKQSGEDIIKTKKSLKVVELPKCFDVIWQVTHNEVTPLVCKDNKTVVAETEEDTELFAIDYSEIDSLPEDQLTDAKFVYSLAYILSQKNKANLGVAVLRKAGDIANSKKLQKSFTVSQKGQTENFLKSLALAKGLVNKQEAGNTIPVNDFIATIKSNLGKVGINMAYSSYKSITRKGDDASKVKFDLTDSNAKIIGIVGNENRANISLLTVRNGNITSVPDNDLFVRINEFNTRSDKQILFPIPTETYRNYTLVANGDFNFDELSLEFTDPSNASGYTIKPSEAIDLFDENQKEIKISDFVNIYKTLIAEKAHASVLRFYIKANSEQKHAVDKRVELYGVEGAKLAEEMGLDYAMRFAPKSEYKAKDENADYVPFLELTGKLRGAATISASASYTKYEKKGKPNVGDDICWPLFEKYDDLLAKLGKSVFVELCQKTLEGVEDTVDMLSQKISNMKFYLMITNSWFSDVDKADEFEYDGLVINTKEVKEFL